MVRPVPIVRTFDDEAAEVPAPLSFESRYVDSPIIIDNGSFECRAGYAVQSAPAMVFPNCVVRSKARGNEPASIIVGAAIGEMDAQRHTARPIFDRGVVTGHGAQEDCLDYIFAGLGVTTDSVSHPIMITEPVCCPPYCRKRMNELLFECYNVPATSHAVDALLSFHESNVSAGRTARYGIVISLGHHATHILPLVDGRLDAPNCKRLEIGGQQLLDYLSRLVSLKHPSLIGLLQPRHIQTMLHKSCYVAKDYQAELSDWMQRSYSTSHTHIYQLPFAQPDQKQQEEQLRRRQQQGQRLKDFMMKKREKELQELKGQLEDLQAIAELPEAKMKAQAKQIGLASAQHLYSAIADLEDAVRRKNNKILGIVETVEVNKKEPVYDLLDIDDSELTDEQKVEKRKQRLMKNAQEGRERAKQERLKLQKEKDMQQKADEERRLADPQKWLEELREKKQELLKHRLQRQRLREELSNRHSNAAKQRMRMIVQQANDQAGSKKGKKSTAQDDTFGVEDAHWDVYRMIGREDDELEEEENEKLAEIEHLLGAHDPDYVGDVGPQSIEEQYQIQLAVERARVPELLFQPGMVGISQAGLIDTLEWVLNYYPDNIQQQMVQNIHVTGGLANLPYMVDRIRAAVQSIRPFRSTFHVESPHDVMKAPWRGGRVLANQWTGEGASSGWVSREEYYEKGDEYLKENECTNRLYSLPA